MVKKNFASAWNSSKQPRKQRKYRHNAPLHKKGDFVSSHLSKELKEKYSKRSARVRKGDKVMVSRGQFKGTSGKVERVDVKNTKTYIAGVETVKKDGTKSFYPIHPSNLIIIELNLEDKKRSKSLERK